MKKYELQTVLSLEGAAAIKFAKQQKKQFGGYGALCLLVLVAFIVLALRTVLPGFVRRNKVHNPHKL